LSVTGKRDTVNPPSAALALKLGFRGEAPFVELAFLGRAKPSPSRQWTAVPDDAGIIRRQRADDVEGLA
jgi:hypothetical protein